jgi:hypothetical protein
MGQSKKIKIKLIVPLGGKNGLSIIEEEKILDFYVPHRLAANEKELLNFLDPILGLKSLKTSRIESKDQSVDKGTILDFYKAASCLTGPLV